MIASPIVPFFSMGTLTVLVEDGYMSQLSSRSPVRLFVTVYLVFTEQLSFFKYAISVLA